MKKMNLKQILSLLAVMSISLLHSQSKAADYVFETIGIEPGSSQQLKCLTSFDLGYPSSVIESLSLEDVCVEWSDGINPMTRVLEGELSTLVDGKATISLYPTVNDLKLAGDAVLKVKGTAMVEGSSRVIDEEVPFSAYTVSLTDDSRSKVYGNVPDLMLEITNLEVSKLENYFHYLNVSQPIDGEMMTVGRANFFTTCELGNVSLFSTSMQLDRLAEPGVLYVSGELSYYDQNDVLKVIPFPVDSVYYLPIKPLIEEPIVELSELLTFTFALPEGFDYSDPDFSASTVYYYEDADKQQPVVLLQSPTSSIEGNMLTLNFPMQEGIIDADEVYVRLSGNMEVDGHRLVVDQFWSFLHPNFKGEILHVPATASGDEYLPERYNSSMCFTCSSDLHTSMMLQGAINASFIEASGRIFGIVDGQEVTIMTLANVDSQGLESWTQHYNYLPYVILEWESQSDAHVFELYCDMNATFVIDGQTFEYHSDPSVQWGTYFYKPEPSMAEGCIIGSVYDLEALTFEMPDYMKNARYNSCWIYCEIRYEDSGANNKESFAPTYSDGIILPGFDFTYTYLRDDMEPIGYDVTIKGSSYDENNVSMGSFDHIYHYYSDYDAGIDRVAADELPASTYNMAGIRVDENKAKGLVIRNGKILLIR